MVYSLFWRVPTWNFEENCITHFLIMFGPWRMQSMVDLPVRKMGRHTNFCVYRILGALPPRLAYEKVERFRRKPEFRIDWGVGGKFKIGDYREIDLAQRTCAHIAKVLGEVLARSFLRFRDLAHGVVATSGEEQRSYGKRAIVGTWKPPHRRVSSRISRTTQLLLALVCSFSYSVWGTLSASFWAWESSVKPRLRGPTIVFFLGLARFIARTRQGGGQGGYSRSSSVVA